MSIQNQLSLQITSKILDIKDVSIGTFRRTRVIFKNGYYLSIITGTYAYCGAGEFEIAIYDAGEIFCPDLFYDEDKGDDVLGYCSVEKVKKYIEKMACVMH